MSISRGRLAFSKTPVDRPISLSALAAGPHYVEVVRKRDSGLYPDDPVLGTSAVVTRSRTWIVETKQ